MPRPATLPALLLALLLALAVLASAGCGDGGDGTPTPSRTIGPTPATTSTPTATPTAPADSTPSPSGAVRISPPANRSEFLDELAKKDIAKQACVYDASTSAADCGDSGLYELDPAFPEEGAESVECGVFIVEGDPVAVSCATAATAIIYEIP
jgi:hypothetical protein